MSYFEKIGNTISTKSKELVSRAKAVSETSSLNNVIKTERNKIDTNYKMMGKLYFELYGSAPAKEFAEPIADVKASLDKIAETQEAIEKIRRRNNCPNCGERFKSGALFCSKCGTRVREDKPEPADRICANCGNKLDGDALFCDSCGTKVSEIPENLSSGSSTDEVKPDIPEIQFESNITKKNNTDTEKKEISQSPAENSNSAAEKAENVQPAKPEKEPVSDLKKCPECGNVQEDAEALFCTGCGAKF